MTARKASSNSPTRERLCDVCELIQQLGSQDALERLSARNALVSIGGMAVPGLIKCLSDRRKQVRWEAAKALGEIADPIAATALVGALEDRDGDVRWVATVALIAIGREGLRPLLEALIERSDSDWLRQGAHHLCHDLAKKPEGWIVEPVLNALNASEPEVFVPSAAYSALNNL